MSGISDALRQMRLPPGLSQDLLVAAADALDRAEAGRAADHQNTKHLIQGLRDTFRDEKDAWQLEREKMENDLGEVIDQRDEYHDMADRLAHAIADHFLAPIGEHSSANCPWMRALELIENPPDAAPAADGDALRRDVARAICIADGAEPDQVIWQGNPPEPYGNVLGEYLKHADAAIAALRASKGDAA